MSLETMVDGKKWRADTANNLDHWVRIWVGAKDAETNEYVVDPDDILEEARLNCSSYCAEVGLCVSVTPTYFSYGSNSKGGGEHGFVVGLLNYPRFPLEPEKLKAHAVALALRLAEHFKQCRVTVESGSVTLMLTDTEREKRLEARK